MKTRIISGLIMAPLLVVLYFRGIPLALATFIVGAIGIYELFEGFKKLDIKPNIFIAEGMLILLYFIHFLVPGRLDYIMAWIVLSIVASGVSIFTVEKHKIEDALATLIGIVYVGFLSYHMAMIDETSYGILVWMVAIVAFGTDIAAYFTGYFLGKHKLCPNLSPKKTIEGAIGGVLGALILGIIFGLIFKIKIFPHIILMSIIGSVLSQLGDLTASAFKRKMGIKDYGNLIPGHGGILDRFDSVLFAAPAIYYYIQLAIAK
ncbi:MAG: phosphatidate cytidylyltransferase [Firmicutes bacterium]|nr:phosphatidate cytidylyltransferase [Bacillota bacterium]